MPACGLQPHLVAYRYVGPTRISGINTPESYVTKEIYATLLPNSVVSAATPVREPDGRVEFPH